MTEYEYLMEKRAAAEDKVVSGKAATVEQLIAKYKANPNPATLKALADGLADLKKSNPAHLDSGYYGITRMGNSRADEMWDRGNYVRGAINKALAVPVAAIGETMLSPVRAITRAIAPDTNITFDDEKDLAHRNPTDDLERNVNAARELLKLYGNKRENPTEQFEASKNLTNMFKHRTEQTIGDTLAGVPIGYIPYVGEALSDIAAAPHTALFNAVGLNGKPREEWEKEQREKKASYDALMEKKADLSSQATKGLIGAGIGSLIGGGAGYLTGEDENTAKGIKGTKLRNALIGGILGAAGGGGIGAALGKSDDVRQIAALDNRLLDSSIQDDLDAASRATRQQFKAQDEKIKQGLGKHDDLIDALAFVSLKGDDERFSPGRISIYGQRKLRRSIPTLVERLIPYSKKLQGLRKLPQDMIKQLDSELDNRLGVNKY